MTLATHMVNAVDLAIKAKTFFARYRYLGLLQAQFSSSTGYEGVKRLSSKMKTHSP
jgi:hypothetical protein